MHGLPTDWAGWQLTLPQVSGLNGFHLQTKAELEIADGVMCAICCGLSLSCCCRHFVSCLNLGGGPKDCLIAALYLLTGCVDAGEALWVNGCKRDDDSLAGQRISTNAIAKGKSQRIPVIVRRMKRSAPE